MIKFAEGCRQTLRPKAKRHLTFLLSAVPLHGKMGTDQEEQNEQSTMAKDFRKERYCRFQIRRHETKSVISLLQVQPATVKLPIDIQKINKSSKNRC